MNRVAPCLAITFMVGGFVMAWHATMRRCRILTATVPVEEPVPYELTPLADLVDTRTEGEINEEWDAFFEHCPRDQWDVFLWLNRQHERWLRGEPQESPTPAWPYDQEKP